MSHTIAVIMSFVALYMSALAWSKHTVAGFWKESSNFWYQRYRDADQRAHDRTQAFLDWTTKVDPLRRM